MTVEEVDRIDMIAQREGAPGLLLVIADHLNWDDEERHLLALQAKLNAYLGYIEGGQLEQQNPGASGGPVTIQVAMKHEPPPTVVDRFFLPARSVVEGAGFQFDWKVR